MLVHDFGDDGKAQADAGFLGGDERIEDLLAHLGGDAGAGVGNRTSTPSGAAALGRLMSHLQFAAVSLMAS